MKRRSTGSPLSPVGTHAGDRTSQEDRPRRLRGATLTLRKSVTHSARSQVRDHFAARRRPAEKPDKLEARGRRGLEPMTGKMQVKRAGSSQNNTASGGPTKATCLRPTPFSPTAAHATYRYLGHTRPAQLRRRCGGGI